MKVTLKLHAKLAECLPVDARVSGTLAVSLQPGATVDSLIKQFKVPPNLCHLVLVDGVFVPPAARSARALADGETLTVWPPVAGG